MHDAPVEVGDIVAGKYRIERILGAGAMGVVLAATQLALGRKVALKFMTRGSAAGPEHRDRFLREARVAAMLESQHAAKVLDVGTAEAGVPYIVMEFLDGKDLAAILRERGPLDVAVAVTYVLQVCEAVVEAHAIGIVHRDIKPANLFLTRSANGSPCVKLVDFGIAKLVDGGLDLTGTAQTLGSPLYMSPEQLNAPRIVDGRTDIWALGVTLYELLTRATPFPGETVLQVTTRIFLEPPVPLANLRPEVPPGLAAVIARCLEKDREKRWRRAEDFAAALAPYAARLSPDRDDRPDRGPRGVASSALSPVISFIGPKDTRAEPFVFRLLIAVAGLILAVALVSVALRGRGTRRVALNVEAGTETSVPAPAPSPIPEVAAVIPSAVVTAAPETTARPRENTTSAPGVRKQEHRHSQPAPAASPSEVDPFARVRK